MDYTKAVNNRKSIRVFKDTQLTESQIADILAYTKECRRLIPEIDVEFQLITGDDTAAVIDNAGYEGMTFGAPAYLILLTDLEYGFVENAGYINEDMILYMTVSGLDTCWLTVNHGIALKDALGLTCSKMIAAVTAIGYGQKENSLTGLHMKSASDVTVVTREGHVAPKIALSDMVYEETWGNPAELGEEYVEDGLRNAFYAASYAPTFLNRQFFRLIMADGHILLVKKLDVLSGEYDALLSCGAVMLNFASVLDERRPFKTEWLLGEPEKVYEFPADCEIIGFCDI